MNRFEPNELIVIRIDAEREEESSVATIDQFVITEL